MLPPSTWLNWPAAKKDAPLPLPPSSVLLDGEGAKGAGGSALGGSGSVATVYAAPFSPIAAATLVQATPSQSAS